MRVRFQLAKEMKSSDVNGLKRTGLMAHQRRVTEGCVLGTNRHF